MRRWFKIFAYTLLGFIPLLFIALFLGVGFPESSMLANIGDGLGVAVICTLPLIAILATITGIGALIERYLAGNFSEKQKRDVIMNVQVDSPDLQRILNRLSDSDREVLENYLTVHQLGLTDDGEMMSLDELLNGADDDIKSMFVG